MNHQEKQEIFDQYAKSAGYKDFIKIGQTYSPRIVMHYNFAACDLVQEEQQKRIAKKFSELVHSNEVDYIFIGDYNKMKASIINPENKIM